MNPFTKAAQAKGWTGDEIAALWRVSGRQIANVASNPKPRDWYALAGMENKSGLVPRKVDSGYQVLMGKWSA